MSEATASSAADAVLTAFRLHPGGGMPLVPAPAPRQWMESTAEPFAYRCLPLKMANEAGWVLLNPSPVLVT